MNTKRIQQTKVKKLWDFPPLSDGKQGRVFTKHLMNLSLILDPNHYALLSFLVYQSGADNTFKYTTTLLKQYERATELAGKKYGLKTALMTSLPKSRGHFVYLIENGLILPTDKVKIFLINPCLTYSKLYVKAEFYKDWMYAYYEGGNIKSLISEYISHVDKNFKSRGKRL